MGEDDKKPEETKVEEKKPEVKKEEKPKPEEKKAESSKEKATVEAPPPPPQEIVLRVFMHCEGCARKVRRCLKGFEGVEDVITDCKTHKVVVKGEKADPLKVVERVQKKSHRQVDLLSPIPKPPPQPAEDVKKADEKEAPKAEEKKEEVITVVLSVQMHCEACAEEIKKRILRMKGVENVKPDLKISQVTVNGVFDPPNLIEYIHKRTGKHVSIVKQETEKKKEETKKEETKKEEKKPKTDEKKEKNPGNKAENIKTTAEEKKDGAEVAVVVAPAAGDEPGKVVDTKKSEFYYTDPVDFQIYPHPQMYDNAYAYHTPAPQMFSDENPNACTVM